MSRLVIARTLNGFGLMAGTVAAHLSLFGILGVIVTTPTLCPESMGATRCSAAGLKAAGLAAYGFIGAGLAGSLMIAGKLADAEA